MADLYNVIFSFPQLQRLAGKLNLPCRVVYGGRTFLRRILDTMNSMSPSTKHRLTPSFYRDISWWVNFLHVFNGTQIFLNQQPTVDVMADACPLAAGGCYHSQRQSSGCQQRYHRE